MFSKSSGNDLKIQLNLIQDIYILINQKRIGQKKDKIKDA